MARVLVTGATGQIGSALVPALRERYGRSAVIAAGHRSAPCPAVADGPCVDLEITDRTAVLRLVREHRSETVYHLAAVLSAAGERDPQRAWEVNMGGLLNVLEAAREVPGCAVFFPSSIGAFGPTTPREDTPQETIQRPATIYGITKLAGELLCDYHFRRYGTDTRGLRFPGLVSHEHAPGGGTTDYAVEIFHGALRERRYACFLAPGTRLDLMYMPDAVRAAIELMEADGARLGHRNAYNVTAMSVTPEELAAEIRRHVPGFAMTHEVDPVRQGIAEGWPRHMDDRAAREEWGWRPAWDLAAMTRDMLGRLAAHLGAEGRR